MALHRGFQGTRGKLRKPAFFVCRFTLDNSNTHRSIAGSFVLSAFPHLIQNAQYAGGR